MGDDAADAVIEYAVALGRKDSADSVSLNVLNLRGEPQVVVFLLGPATMMTSESVESEFDEPDNALAVKHMAERTTRTLPPVPTATRDAPPIDYIEDL